LVCGTLVGSYFRSKLLFRLLGSISPLNLNARSTNLQPLGVEQISRLVGHSSIAVTETVCRHQLNPVVEDGATAMDGILPTTAA
jgi:hypothetical protein